VYRAAPGAVKLRAARFNRFGFDSPHQLGDELRAAKSYLKLGGECGIRTSGGGFAARSQPSTDVHEVPFSI